jgi:hypothetical protein
MRMGEGSLSEPCQASQLSKGAQDWRQLLALGWGG